MSSATTDPTIDKLLTFWFDGPGNERWFGQNDELDDQIRTEFGNHVARARTLELDHWTEDPRGSLALIILLDQFSRNIYRGTPDSFNADPKALDMTTKAVAKGFDKQVPLVQQMFFYLPFMHHEGLLGQIAGLALYEGFVTRCDVDPRAREAAVRAVAFAKQHLDVILRFGRFPARNKAIGRASTPEEEAFLKDHPYGL
ncbi:MAG: hypothetical protein OHK93_001625 [Ramalina farinacea]|uniref:DUF924 domain-containing protein n=1 Tax=Ramalina farinacea TaxID=258253 RepID=A0AA43QPY1_9LECA|nr:hypothetical protein [Ramalina farinacea]